MVVGEEVIHHMAVSHLASDLLVFDVFQGKLLTSLALHYLDFYLEIQEVKEI